MNETEERLIAMETKIAYMDDFIVKLQEQAVENTKTIELLREEIKILSSRIKELGDSEDIPNRRPPHY